MKRFALTAALLLAPFAVHPAFAADKTAANATDAQHDTVIEEIIARVNDSIITRTELQRQRNDMEQEAKQRNETSKLPDMEKNLLRDLIDQQLLIDKGKQLGITGDTELVKRLDEIRKQNNMESIDDLEKAAQEQGVSFEDFKQNIRNSIISQEVVRDEVGRMVHLSQADEQAWYNAHKSELSRPEHVRLSEILISTAAPANAPNGPEQEQARQAEALQKAQALEARLHAGAKFDDVAKTDSNGPTAAQGGDLGNFERGQLAKELEDKTFPLKPGETTEPILTKQGYVILKVTEHAPGGVPAFKDVEPQIQEALYMERLQPALRTYLTKLREEAFIDIKPGYDDTGASPNETKPVYTASTGPDTGGKKAKKSGGGKKINIRKQG